MVEFGLARTYIFLDYHLSRLILSGLELLELSHTVAIPRQQIVDFSGRISRATTPWVLKKMVNILFLLRKLVFRT